MTTQNRQKTKTVFKTQFVKQIKNMQNVILSFKYIFQISHSFKGYYHDNQNLSQNTLDITQITNRHIQKHSQYCFDINSYYHFQND